MCLTTGVIGNTGRWNWDGDRIIFDAVLPSGRPPVLRKRGMYPTDVREFLVAEKNSVMRGILQEKIPQFIERKKLEPQKFFAREGGAFDFRVHAIAAFVATWVSYSSRKGHDPWQFPEETAFLRKGDCEDIAFLLASLMLAAGVSGYNVRVALGKMRLRHSNGKVTQHDHMWVVYKSEAGRWLVIEPLHLARSPAAAGRAKPLRAGPRLERADYEPRFLFNEDHVWQVGRDGPAGKLSEFVERQWSRLNPKFAGEVHQTILREALKDVAPQWVRDALNRHFCSIFGRVVDDFDNFVAMGYDPRDHFDNGYIDLGWKRVGERLEKFKADNNNLDDFAYAAHGIADFYAHSSYLHFAKVGNDDAAQPYDPEQPLAALPAAPKYDAASRFAIGAAPFTVNPTVYKGDPKDAPALWDGKLISGRYAQIRDSHGWLEGPVTIPDSLIESDQIFPRRGALPHHEEIAVDSAKMEKGHCLYGRSAGDGTARYSYQNQFRWRKNTAVAHIRKAFVDNWTGGAPSSSGKP